MGFGVGEVDMIEYTAEATTIDGPARGRDDPATMALHVLPRKDRQQSRTSGSRSSGSSVRNPSNSGLTRRLLLPRNCKPGADRPNIARTATDSRRPYAPPIPVEPEYQRHMGAPSSILPGMPCVRQVGIRPARDRHHHRVPIWSPTKRWPARVQRKGQFELRMMMPSERDGSSSRRSSRIDEALVAFGSSAEQPSYCALLAHDARLVPILHVRATWPATEA